MQILSLQPDRAVDYFDFFENRAFTDGTPYRCYCQHNQMSDTRFTEAFANVKPEDMGVAARNVAEQQIMKGEMRGLLAYVDGVAIGWCNCNDRSAYPVNSRGGAYLHAPAEAREWAVVCFEIAPEYRGRGVATSLLQRAVSDAAVAGAVAVYGFPIVRGERFEWDYCGPVRLYEKLGFTKTGMADDEHAIMVKKLI